MVYKSHLFINSNSWNHLNCVQTNDQNQIEILMLHSNTWNYLNVSKIINIM